MSTFNVFGGGHRKVGENYPIWLGTVKPVPVGGIIEGVEKGTFLRAGLAVSYDAATKKITPVTSDTGTPNAYLYNDVYVDSDDAVASGAVVMSHAEGILIDRTPNSAAIVAKLKTNVPNVIQVKG